MKALAQNALDAAVRRGISYADVRVVEDRDRHVSTKNGKAGDVSISSSLGLGVRVLDKGCWGFAATDDLTPDGLEAAAALAVEIARASSIAKKHDIQLAPDKHFVVNRAAITVYRQAGDTTVPAWRLDPKTGKSNGATIGV